MLRNGIAKNRPLSGEKLTTLLAVYQHYGFDQAPEKMRGIFEGGKGRSRGIYSLHEQHLGVGVRSPRIDRLTASSSAKRVSSRSVLSGHRRPRSRRR